MLDIRRNKYGYYVQCEQCRHRQEVTREDAEDDLVECDHCGHTIGEPEDDGFSDEKDELEDS